MIIVGGWDRGSVIGIHGGKSICKSNCVLGASFFRNIRARKANNYVL